MEEESDTIPEMKMHLASTPDTEWYNFELTPSLKILSKNCEIVKSWKQVYTLFIQSS